VTYPRLQTNRNNLKLEIPALDLLAVRFKFQDMENSELLTILFIKETFINTNDMGRAHKLMSEYHSSDFL
jgi:hypothetical protein